MNDTSAPREAALGTVLLLTVNYTLTLAGGLGTHVHEIAQGLRGQGCEVIIITNATGATAVVEEQGVQIHFVGASPRTLAQTAQSSIAQNMLAFNQDIIDYAQPLLAQAARRPDIIHYQHWFTFAAARQLGAAFNIPIVGSIHYLTHPIEYWWGETPNPGVAQQENIWFHNAQDLITVSESMRRLVEQYYPATRGKIHVVYNSVNLEVFWSTPLSAEARARLRRTIAKSGERIIMFAGRVNPMKGLEPLVDAAALVVRQEPNVRYLIAGAPDSRDYLRTIQARVRRHPDLEPRVTFLGKVARQQLALLFQVADIAVFPSIYEPFGMVAVEAMVSGVPPIITDNGGWAEIVPHEQMGLHVPVRPDPASGRYLVDVEQLAAAQLRLLRDEPFRQRLGQAGQHYLRHEFTFLKWMLHPMMEVYRRTIAAHHARAAAQREQAAPAEELA